MERWGRIDVLVNSAGHGPRAPILEITDEQWRTGLDTYLMNVIRATRLVAPIMVKQKSGSIINISTAWIFEPSAMFPTSAVARAGLAAYTKIFATQYAPDNVRMNNVLPGWIDSLPGTDERWLICQVTTKGGLKAMGALREHESGMLVMLVQGKGPDGQTVQVEHYFDWSDLDSLGILKREPTKLVG